MNKMIVAMDYTQDGSRTITLILSMTDWTYDSMMARAENFKSSSDEVYIVDFNLNNKDLINEIVTKGCRL